MFVINQTSVIDIELILTVMDDQSMSRSQLQQEQ